MNNLSFICPRFSNYRKQHCSRLILQTSLYSFLFLICTLTLTIIVAYFQYYVYNENISRNALRFFHTIAKRGYR